MAKVLISSLGTGVKKDENDNKSRDGNYKKATYSIDGEEYQESFIAIALKKHFNIDKIYLVGTKKSIWDEAYLEFGGEDLEYASKLYDKKEEGTTNKEDLLKLEQLLGKDSKTFIIDYGINDDELWANFEQFLSIAKNIENGDELYLDITHSFRSLALMSFVMTQFVKTISDKSFTIAGVFYGMFEYSFEKELSKGKTPIVNIKLFLELQEWIKAIEAIKKYSDFDPLVQLLKDQDDTQKKLKNTFIQLNHNIRISNMAVMQQFVNKAKEKLNIIETSQNKIVKLLVPEIYKLVNELDSDKLSLFQFNCAKWFYKNKNYAMSYIALAEAIVSKICEQQFMTTEAIINQEYSKELRYEAKKNIPKKWKTNYYKINTIRNNIAHQLSEKQNDVNQNIEQLKKFLELFEEFFNTE